MLENLKAATFEVFESMFFLFPEPPLLEPPVFKGPGVQAWVPVQGPRAFRIGLTVPQSLARKMAANFLGLATNDPTVEQIRDAVQEGANMVAGSFLAREGASPAFHLQPPQSRLLDLGSPLFRLSLNHLLLLVDDDSLEVFVEKI
ncbi:MAG: chemotaxis protein CheX [Syntrophobacterales bacterium]|nr:chemotaxis protein CheX [Syntrophobacterales bacterium]